MPTNLKKTKNWWFILLDHGIKPGNGDLTRLAKKLNIDKSNLSAILRGRRLPSVRPWKKRVSETERLSAFFGLSHQEVLGLCQKARKERK